jgi:hypothetical protein
MLYLTLLLLLELLRLPRLLLLLKTRQLLMSSSTEPYAAGAGAAAAVKPAVAAEDVTAPHVEQHRAIACSVNAPAIFMSSLLSLTPLLPRLSSISITQL